MLGPTIMTFKLLGLIKILAIWEKKKLPIPKPPSIIPEIKPALSGKWPTLFYIGII